MTRNGMDINRISRNRISRERAGQRWLASLLITAAASLFSWAAMADAVSQQESDALCADRTLFEAEAWQHEEIQHAMDDYLLKHRMRARWMQEPIPPDQIGKDYYEWLWQSSFGAGMKQELVNRYCGSIEAA